MNLKLALPQQLRRTRGFPSGRRRISQTNNVRFVAYSVLNPSLRHGSGFLSLFPSLRSVVGKAFSSHRIHSAQHPPSGRLQSLNPAIAGKIRAHLSGGGKVSRLVAVNRIEEGMPCFTMDRDLLPATYMPLV